jgi:formyltetrahydrofolate deformylase
LRPKLPYLQLASQYPARSDAGGLAAVVVSHFGSDIMSEKMKNTAVLLLSVPMCIARKGVVAAISQFLIAHNGSVLHSDDHLDSGRDVFLSRLEWDLNGFDVPISEFDHYFKPMAERFQINYHLALADYRPKMAILVSAYDHCLADLLYRHRIGELPCDIVRIISNHARAKPLADFSEVPFHLLTNPNDKSESEREMLELLGQDVDLIVLARYMQILGPHFVAQYLLRMINIHHSFLPSFVGAKPYHQAFERGVKLIGATSHYVTATLDEGPIIEQDVVRVSHRDSVQDMVRKGRDLEKVVLSRAVRWHLENRVLVYRKKTVVFV